MKYLISIVALLICQQGYSATEKSYPRFAAALLAQSFEDNSSNTVDDKTMILADKFLTVGVKYPIVKSFCNSCDYSFKLRCKFDDLESREAFKKVSKMLFHETAICRVTATENEFLSEYEISLYKIHHEANQAYPHFPSIQKAFDYAMGSTASMEVDYLGHKLPTVEELFPDGFWLTFYENENNVKCFAFYPETDQIIEDGV